MLINHHFAIHQNMKTVSILVSLYVSLVEASSVAADTSPRNLQQIGFDREDTAIVIIDPQNDFLSPEGVTWGKFEVCYSLVVVYCR